MQSLLHSTPRDAITLHKHSQETNFKGETRDSGILPRDGSSSCHSPVGVPQVRKMRTGFSKPGEPIQRFSDDNANALEGASPQSGQLTHQ
jgi:hypothetical protein